MTEVPWVAVEPLGDGHNIADFTSGRESVDSWFREKARSSSHLTATKVFVDEHGVICGFFALRGILMNTDGLSSKLRRACSGEELVPAILLAQMAVAEQHQGNGHGGRLFFRAAQEAVAAYEATRIQLFALDAADEGLVSFYEGLGMKRIPNSLRLATLLSKIPRAK